MSSLMHKITVNECNNFEMPFFPSYQVVVSKGKYKPIYC